LKPGPVQQVHSLTRDWNQAGLKKNKEKKNSIDPAG
jgi:hypothetical protein